VEGYSPVTCLTRNKNVFIVGLEDGTIIVFDVIKAE